MSAARFGSRARWWSGLGATCLVLTLSAPAARAGLFDDDEARRAILDLRQKIEQSNEQARAAQAEQIGQLRANLADLSRQIDLMRTENASLRDQVEQMARDVGLMQVQLKDMKQDYDERLARIEPQKASVDGREFMADAEEIRQYEAAMAKVRGGDFAGAATSLAVFRSRYPSSGYAQSVLFWLGNAQYGNRSYAEAISSFRSFASSYPGDLRAPEALLAIANCQFELKDTKAARKVLDELFKTYPDSEAAQAGKARLAALK
ncbi:MAG: tol-pal system protein YbgF [Burkholderiales bacterium PBB1]|nr:MAG: tol-pal system protein YbgF [Burkholderiales bacterium PBB1]